MKKLIQTLLLPAALLVLGQGAFAQATVGAGTAPQSYSVLEMVGSYTTGAFGGMRLPQIENASQRPVIPAGEENNARGLTVFNLETSSIEYFDGENWVVKSDPCATPTGETAQSFCTGAKVSDLTTTSGGNIQWFSAATGGTALSVDATLTNNITYYASLNGCTGTDRLAVRATVTTVAQPTATAQSFCGTATGSSLNPAPGTAARKWYDSFGMEVTAATNLTTGTYKLVATSGVCESTPRDVAVTINTIPSAPTGITSPQNLCASVATGANLTPSASSSSYKWYATNISTTALTTTSTISAGTYYIASVNNGCEGPRTPVEITITTTTTPTFTFNTSTNYLLGLSLSLFAATANEPGTITWYTTSTGATTASTLPTSGNNNNTTYYVTRTVDGCESARVSVTIKSTKTGSSTVQ